MFLGADGQVHKPRSRIAAKYHHHVPIAEVAVAFCEIFLICNVMASSNVQIA